ncbi:sensor histidine kinase [Actinoplanes couchii]|uniref:histidine kinase n=1 Tax=Actinoplanes couchii TaxID=403638 RepID=A0ABQ3XGB3_9ACTN|nr:histidine kinase [Actinoplanes couchii]MDR6321024.1 signal transduction histidine kinase [Actinoplanes couchii]GID57535.1 two-component sensor histidine kinase [Actinoplanes couchii]
MRTSSPEYRWLWPSALAADPAGPVPARRSTRDWIVDTVCFALAITFAVWITRDLLHGVPPTTAAQWSPSPAWLAVTDGVASVIAAIGLWWRRRFLTPLALYVGLLAYFSLASGMALLIVVFTVAVHRRFSILAVYVVFVAFGNLTFAMLRPESNAGMWETFWWGMVLVVICALWGMQVRARRQLIVSWRDRAERAEAEQRLRIAQARVLERTRIAREMHDVLAHRISLLSLHAGALEFRPGAPPEEIAGAASVVRASAHQALQDLRAVIGVLRTGQPEDEDTPERPQPTLSALPALAEESRAAGMRVRLDILADPETVPSATGRAAYRIVQEALTNVRKHAPGAAVRVGVSGSVGDGLTLEIRNPMPVTVPVTPIPGTGVGLIGLAERALLAGGRLDHGRADDDFVLTAWLPWPP